jgi:ribulose-phosphate 3-epimerase
MCFPRILTNLRNSVPLVNPSLLSCDFAHLADEIRKLEDSGAKMLHLDVMDAHFAPNLSIGVPIVEAVRRSTDLPLDVHLMLSEPQRYVRTFRNAGADILTVHIEVAPDPKAILEEIHDLGAAAGLSLNPPTPVAALEKYLDLCDLVLVMSVMPGFGGQEFNPAALKKLRQLREKSDPRVLLSVDGGVQYNTIGPCSHAGADLLVTGSALFAQNDYRTFIDEMTSLAVSARNVNV